MYNRERLTRWLFYIFAAFVVASCGGGGDIFSVNGQSSTSVSLQLDSDQITSTGQTNVTVKLRDANNNPLSGSVNLALSGAGAIGSKTVAVVGGVGATTLSGHGALPGSTGDVQAMYVDAQKNVSKSTPVPYSIIDAAAVPSNYKLSAPTICVAGEALPCNSVIYISGTEKSTATVSATLQSPSGQPVANARVIFALTVPNRGTLSAIGAAAADAANSSVQAIGLTDAAGKASVTLSGLGSGAGFGTVHVSYTDPNTSVVSKDGSYRVQSGYSISLSSGPSNVIAASLGAAIDITATVTTPDGVSANGVPVIFSVPTNSGAQLVNGNAAGAIVTANGQAVQTMKLVSRTQFNNGSITVSARLQNDSTVDAVTYVVQVSGASLMLKSDVTTVQADQLVNFVASLKDGGGNAIAGQSLNVIGTNLSVVSASNNGVTDASGQVAVSAKVTANSGLATLAANWGGSTVADSKSLSIKSTAFSIVSNESPVDLTRLPIQDVNGNTIDHPFTLTLTGAKGNETPSIYSTLGQLSAPVQKSVGVWTFNINSSFPGDALIEADVANPDTADTANPKLQVLQKVTFASTFPKRLTLQASQTSLKTGAQTQLIARVTDANDNPVSGVIVSFNRLTDPSNGLLDAATSTTDSTGRAVVTFTAGPNTTGTDKVRIQASTAGVTAGTVDITVGGAAVFVSIGTGVIIVEDTSTGYQLPHQITVTDAAGNPVSNATVVLKVIPVQYRKGIYVFDPIQKVWAGRNGNDTGPVVECSNEDSNLNGILDLLENNGVGRVMSSDEYPSLTAIDVEDNKDGVLWPGNPVTLSSGTVTTGVNGVGYFSVNYARSQTSWVKVKIIATVLVSGSESRAERIFVLPGLAKDFTDPAVSPPGGLVSPYGKALVCTDKN